METLWVTLLGLPGAGKTTVGQALERSGHPSLGKVRYVSGSRLLEKYIESEGQGWRGLKARKDEGHAADQAFTHELLGGCLGSLSDCGVVLLDGFPKGITEIALTEGVLPHGVDLALLLECPPTERVRRIANRRVCEACGAVTAASGNSNHAGVCSCGGCLFQREDDNPEVLSFREQSAPPWKLARHYEQTNRLLTIDASQPEEAVLEDVIVSIEETAPRISRKIRDH